MHTQIYMYTQTYILFFEESLKLLVGRCYQSAGIEGRHQWSCLALNHMPGKMHK